MAIKGKRKPQSRGSQARRRPAVAPRPVGPRARKVPWYKTTAGQSIAAITTLVLLVVGWALWNNARQNAQQLETSQSRAETYTDQVDAMQQRISEPVTAMAQATTDAPDELSEQAAQWTQLFTGAQTEAAQLIALEEDTLSSQLFTQAVSLFRAAAETLEVAAGLEGKERNDLLSAASTQVQSAVGVWDSGVQSLDAVREDLDLNASGIDSPLQTPAAPAPGGTPPTDNATVPIDNDDQGDGGQGRRGRRNNNNNNDNADG